MSQINFSNLHGMKLAWSWLHTELDIKVRYVETPPFLQIRIRRFSSYFQPKWLLQNSMTNEKVFKKISLLNPWQNLFLYSLEAFIQQMTSL